MLQLPDLASHVLQGFPLHSWPSSRQTHGPQRRHGRLLRGGDSTLDSEPLCRAISDFVPPSTEALNIKAFDAGFDYGVSVLGSPARNESAEPAHLRFDGLA